MKEHALTAALLATLAILSMGLTPGEKAPDFTAKNQDGKVIHLSDFKGKPVLLYFYPKDDTPGCTKEACAFRDGFEKSRKMGLIVLGVSRQDEKSHQAFKAKYHLPFDLLVDTDGKLAAEYGIEDMPLIGYHKRQSILLDGEGKVVRFYPDVNPETHAAEVMADLRKLQKRSG